MKKLNIKIIISGYVDMLIAKLHSIYPHQEWSGIARIEKKDGYYYLSDIRFPKQSNHGAETEIKDGGLQDLLEDILEKDPAHLGEWKCRLHSHHQMGCFWSGTDEIAKQSFNDGQQDFWRSIVTAYKGNNVKYKCALNVYKPIKKEFDINVEVEEFNYKKHFKNGEILEQQISKLEKQKQQKINNISNTFVSNVNDINDLMDIFNVEYTDENRKICESILSKGYNEKVKEQIKNIEDEFEMMKDEIVDHLSDNNFMDKIKELKENIIIDYAIGYNYTGDNRKQVPIREDEDNREISNRKSPNNIYDPDEEYFKYLYKNHG